MNDYLKSIMEPEEILDDLGVAEPPPRLLDPFFQFIEAIPPARQIAFSFFYSFGFYVILEFKAPDPRESSAYYTVLLGALIIPFMLAFLVKGLQTFIFFVLAIFFAVEPKPSRISFTGTTFLISFLCFLIFIILAIFIP